MSTLTDLGYVVLDSHECNGEAVATVECMNCYGAGYVPMANWTSRVCDHCFGSGQVTESVADLVKGA